MNSRTEKLEITPESSRITSGATLPIWTHKVPNYGSFPTLQKDVSADVTIVGGGLGGLQTAYLMSKLGKSVVLVEARDVMSGESGRTTAHLFPAVDDRYFELIKTHGLETAQVVADSQRAAVDLIEKIVKEENIECEFERLDGYLFLGPEHTTALLQKEYDAAKQVGMDVEITTAPFP